LDQKNSEIQEIYSITDLSKEFDISTRTIRFYESKGLICPARAGGTRVFYRGDRARLILILRGKRLGFSLKEIEEYLSLYDSDKTNTEQGKKLLEVIDKRLSLLDGQLKDLKTTVLELKDIKKLTKERLR
jgi:DNA-binding transcriptional MerR regulator